MTEGESLEINDEYGLVHWLLGPGVNLGGRGVETSFKNLGYVALKAGVLTVTLNLPKIPFTKRDVENWNSKIDSSQNMDGVGEFNATLLL